MTLPAKQRQGQRLRLAHSPASPPPPIRRPSNSAFDGRSASDPGPASLVATAAPGDVEAEDGEGDVLQLPPSLLSFNVSQCSLRRKPTSETKAAL